MWSTLKRLSNPSTSRAVLEIVREDKSISSDIKEILERWHGDISRLFSGIRDNPEMAFDEDFYSEIVRKKAEFESLSTEEQNSGNIFDSEMLNSEISYSEVSNAIDSIKRNKAFLEIPNEALKNINSKLLLHRFFSLCFSSGVNPTDWDYSNIKPIPKKGKDQRDPLQNRCITIMCCVAKLYSRILNSRLQKFLETNKLLVEEQNGFRASRSCIDHIFVLCTILRNRKLSGQETFLTFIDFQKAFDSVDRNFLLYKMLQIGITGQMYWAISSLYNNPRSRIILNDSETNYFDCPVGVKQGDCLSPTLFSIFINDIAEEIKQSNIGVKVGEDLLVNILMYADDIVLLAENEHDLQDLLIIVENWCRRWRLDVNISKTKILHVRKPTKPQSKFVFIFNKRPVLYCKHYTYLGITINEHLDLKFTSKVQSDSASRALSVIVTKMIKNGGFPYNIYSLLYDTCVTSISDYGAEIFGFQEYDSNLNLHLRAIRAYIGVPKNATKAGVLSEVDWTLPIFRTQVRMVRYYHRLLKMPPNRLCKQIYNWDKSLNIQNWTNEVKNIFYETGQIHIFESGDIFPIRTIIGKIKSTHTKTQKNMLEMECINKPKLRTFITFKNFETVPAFITKPLSFIQRKYLAKCRLGCLQIRLETGRFSRPILPENERICQVCIKGDPLYLYKNEIESEIHVLFQCNRYKELRYKWLKNLTLPPDFNLLNYYGKLDIVLNHEKNVKMTAQYLIDLMDVRSKVFSDN